MFYLFWLLLCSSGVVASLRAFSRSSFGVEFTDLTPLTFCESLCFIDREVFRQNIFEFRFRDVFYDIRCYPDIVFFYWWSDRWSAQSVLCLEVVFAPWFHWWSRSGFHSRKCTRLWCLGHQSFQWFVILSHLSWQHLWWWPCLLQHIVQARIPFARL